MDYLNKIILEGMWLTNWGNTQLSRSSLIIDLENDANFLRKWGTIKSALSV
jgi:hypothetical protein